MPIVNEKELIEKAKQKEKANQYGVKIETIGDVKVYEGANGVKYTSYGEAFTSLQVKREVEYLKKLGLNDQAQTPKQEAKAKRRAEKLRVKDALLRQLAGIDAEIAQSDRDDDEEDEEDEDSFNPFKKSKRKKKK